MANWKNLLEEAMELRGETLDNLESITLTDAEMEQEFNNDFGCVEGVPFTAWTKNTVYFPLEYDGFETVGSVSRQPDGKPTEHQG